MLCERITLLTKERLSSARHTVLPKAGRDLGFQQYLLSTYYMCQGTAAVDKAEPFLAIGHWH